MKIFKYKITGEYSILMPKGAQILTAQLQGEDICIWAQCDPGEELAPRRVILYGTGWEMEEGVNHSYISTVRQGPFVWHVFEVI